ncbi:MAG TPA: hypothetical protein VGB26_00250 [Nitrospiria bacterium]
MGEYQWIKIHSVRTTVATRLMEIVRQIEYTCYVVSESRNC